MADKHVRMPPGGARAVLPEIGVALAVGGLAGLLVSLFDAAALLVQGAPLRAVLAFSAIVTWTALALAALAMLVLRLSARASTLASIPVQAANAALVTLLMAPVSMQAFSGAGVSRTWLGWSGPWLASGLVFSSVWLLGVIVRRVASRAQRSRWVCSIAAAGCALGAIAISTVDRHYHPHGYLGLHLVLLAATVLTAFFGLWLLRPARTWRLLGVVLPAVLVPATVGFPGSAQERELLAGRPYPATRLVRALQTVVDFDGDGYSPLFGGGDCDDWNAAIHIGAAERPDDGSDSNCDGHDDPPPKAIAAQPFRVDAQRAALIATSARGRPTVVIIIDALRGDRVDDPRFANLSTLAAESIHFTRAFATSSSTATSLPAIVSGRVRPRRGDLTVAQHLGRAGLRTALVSVDVVLASVRGDVAVREVVDFDSFAGFDRLDAIETVHDREGWGGNVTVATDGRVTERALSMLDAEDPPHLLVVHYFDLHQWNLLDLPELPPRMEYERYDAVLERVDQGLAPWIERRDDLNLVILSDHGEAVGARGEAFHTRFVFREMVHVPLLIRVPGVDAARVDTPVSLQGVAGTVLALSGVSAVAELPVASLLGLVGATDVGAGPGFAIFEALEWSLIYGSHRLLHAPAVNASQLFDLSTDPLERKNIAGREPALTQALLWRLREIRRDLVDPDTRPDASRDP